MFSFYGANFQHDLNFIVSILVKTKLVIPNYTHDAKTKSYICENTHPILSIETIVSSFFPKEGQIQCEDMQNTLDTFIGVSMF